MENKRGHAVAKVGKDLLSFACKYTDEVKFGGKVSGFVEPQFIANDMKHPFFRMFENGTIKILFQYMTKPFETIPNRLELMEKINNIIPIGCSESSTLGRIGVDLELLLDPTTFNSFCSIFVEFLNESEVEPKN